MKLTYEGGLRFVAERRGHTISTDLPRDKGGTDLGMTPTELLIVSLGGCIGIYVADYCRNVGLNCDGMTVEVSLEVVESPRRIGRFRIALNVPAGIPEKRRAAVKRVAEHCFIHQTFLHPPEMTIELA